MTKSEISGIKRLRDLSEFGRFAQTLYVSKAHISEIADQIEREHADELANAQRDLTDEYRKTLVKIGCMLGYEDGELPNLPEVLLGELDKRLMPPGCEWPKFEDDEKVMSDNKVRGDEDDEHIVWVISFCKNASWSYRLYDEGGRVIHNTWMPCSKRVKRPVPEVLGADGKPIRKGETVWSIHGRENTVKKLEPYGHNNGEWSETPAVLYEGDCLDGMRSWDYAKNITHTPPDTQERIDEDVRLRPCDYFKAVSCEPCPASRTQETCNKIMCRDLLRRQRELDAKRAGGAA